MNAIKVVIAGAGSAGYGIFRILQEAGCKNIVVTDSKGAIYENRMKVLQKWFSGLDNPYKKEISIKTNPEKQSGSLDDVLKGADYLSAYQERAIY